MSSGLPLPPVPTPPAAPTVHVFDVCDTLFYSNTTFDFLRFVLERERDTGRLRTLQLLSRRWSPLFLGLSAWQRLRGGDPIKTAALRLLRGFSRPRLYALGEEFAAEFLESRKLARPHQLLRELQGQAGGRAVLLSASLDPVIAAIARRLGTEFRSSELNYDAQGNCRGTLRRDLTGQKLVALAELLGSTALPPLTVVTDNFTDRELVTAAAHRHVVVHRAAAKQFWQDLNPDFIEAYPG